MNMNLIIGIFAIIFGVYTLYVRATNPGKFGKLQAMKERFGASAGTTIHIVAYSVLPIVFGIVMLFRGLQE